MHEPLFPYADQLRTMEIDEDEWAEKLEKELKMRSYELRPNGSLHCFYSSSEISIELFRIEVVREIAACVQQTTVGHTYSEIRKAVMKCCTEKAAFHLLTTENQGHVEKDVMTPVRCAVGTSFVRQFSLKESVELAREIVDADEKNSKAAIANMPRELWEECAESIIEASITLYLQHLDQEEG